MIAIDASIAVKLYRDEAGSDAAGALIKEHAGAMMAPDLFALEVCGVIVRDANTDKSAAPVQREKLTHFAALLRSPVLTLVRSSPGDLSRAAELAIHLGHPVKDCLYLALAMELDCDLVTADARFAEKTKGVWDGVRMLGT